MALGTFPRVKAKARSIDSRVGAKIGKLRWAKVPRANADPFVGAVNGVAEVKLYPLCPAPVAGVPHRAVLRPPLGPELLIVTLGEPGVGLTQLPSIRVTGIAHADKELPRQHKADRNNFDNILFFFIFFTSPILSIVCLIPAFTLHGCRVEPHSGNDVIHGNSTKRFSRQANSPARRIFHILMILIKIRRMFIFFRGLTAGWQRLDSVRNSDNNKPALDSSDFDPKSWIKRQIHILEIPNDSKFKIVPQIT
jgi:hypothetical protein